MISDRPPAAGASGPTDTHYGKSGSAAQPALEFRDVSCKFGTYEAVANTSITLADGEFVSVVGPTGCGKSTLLNMAAGLRPPTTGEVLVFSKPLRGINRSAGYLFQSDALMPWRTALDNVKLGLQYHSVDHRTADDKAKYWLDKVGLGRHIHKYPRQLSGGMRKRVALAQTLILDPKIILMDEPFSALDVQTRERMESELLTLWSENQKSVLFITHDLEEAISLSDRVIVLSAGPSTHPINEFEVNLARPRDVSEIRLTPEFLDLHKKIWEVMKTEVMKAYMKSI